MKAGDKRHASYVSTSGYCITFNCVSQSVKFYLCGEKKTASENNSKEKIQLKHPFDSEKCSLRKSLLFDIDSSMDFPILASFLANHF